MIATKCPPAEELRALSTGRLADERGDELLEHIRGCEACRSELETIADAEDSLIASLRSPDSLAPFDAEPDCKLAVAKALGALALASNLPTDPNTLPKTIGEYEIVRPLGRGGMGSVFLARHTKLGREVALKVLAGHRLADSRMRERFEAEMRAVGKLSHPNVVTAHDAREVEGTAVLVTEYIDGFDLAQLVQCTGPLKTADACEVARQVAVAIAYTSQQGFVHRDIKPSNIMLSRRGGVKLLDLGLARLQYEDLEQVGITGTGQTMGTADYVAPEQVTDSRSVDVRADIYSLGCTLFKLLTGVAPFADADHATAFAKMTAHVSKTPPSLAERLPDAPAGLVKLVDSMLAKDPAKRPQTPEAVAAKLTPFAPGCDLERLVAQAEAVPPTKPGPVAVSNSSSTVHTRALPLLRRRVPMVVAIGGGIAGLLLGIFLGILIKIEYPDGTVLNIPVPSGSNVTLEDSSSKQNSPAQQTLPREENRLQANPVAAPLQFAVLVEEDQISRESLESAREELGSSEWAGPVVTEIGTWHPAAPTVPVPVEARHQDQRYALTRDDPNGLIRWEELSRHPRSITYGSSQAVGGFEILNQLKDQLGYSNITIRFRFDRELDKRIREVAGNNLGRQFALVLDNRVISASRVEPALGGKLEFSGNWAKEQKAFFHNALRDLRLNSRRDDAAESTTDAASTESQTEVASDPVEAFQGVWRVVSLTIGGKELDNVSPSVMAFDETDFYICDASFPVGGGTFWVSQEGRHKTIDFRDEVIRDERLPVLRGIYRIRPDGRLEIHSNQGSQGARPSSFDVEDPPSTPVVYTLERIGDLPRTPEEARAMAEGKDEELSQAIMTLVDVAQVPPKSLKPPTREQMKAADEQAITRSNLKTIGIAFHNFHDTFRKFPGSSNKLEGARRTAADRKTYPFSWRVAILPFIGENELYEQYRFHEPWDSEHNSALLSEMPKVYRSPYGSDDEPVPVGHTHYQGFVGEQTALGTDDGVPLQEFTDGTSPTLLIVETRPTVPWTMPQDIPFKKPEDAKNVRPFENVPLNFLTADGNTHSMDPIDWEKLAKLITRNGGESVQP